MATTKTSTLTFRIEPALKEALRLTAAQEHRSIANMVEVMIRDHCARAGVEIVEPDLTKKVAPRRKELLRPNK